MVAECIAAVIPSHEGTAVTAVVEATEDAVMVFMAYRLTGRSKVDRDNKSSEI